MKGITIATLGGHSALEICYGAKKYGFKTLLIVAKGREKTYKEYYRNIINDLIIVDHFKELTDKKIINQLEKNQSIFIPHRYVQVYCDMKKLENAFPVPVFGNRRLLKYEEREGNFTQYQILEIAKVDFPIQFKKPKDIDRLAIVKVKEAVRGYERAFFFANNYTEYKNKAEKMLSKGKIKSADLETAVIEEYLVGPQVNFNFFYSPVLRRLELLGTDMRRQTNIDGFIRLPSFIQSEIADHVTPSYIETGHIGVTVKESLLERAFEIGEKIVVAAAKIEPPGIIGPFAIQTAITAGPPKERIVTYDLSLRMPGSPGTAYTPYSKYLFGKDVAFGERIVMEIENASDKRIITS